MDFLNLLDLFKKSKFGDSQITVGLWKESQSQKKSQSFNFMNCEVLVMAPPYKTKYTIATKKGIWK